MPVPAQVSFEIDVAHSLASVTHSILMRAVQLYSERVVNFKSVRHTCGELAHYFDRLWVLTGLPDERFLCFQQGSVHTFTIFDHYAPSQKADYKDTLNRLELRWYGMKDV